MKHSMRFLFMVTLCILALTVLPGAHHQARALSNDTLVNNMISRGHVPGGKQQAVRCIATTLLNAGFEPTFVAGVSANVIKEGNFGQFESSAYASNEPAYLVYMDNNYNYRNTYSGKRIYNGFSLSTVKIILTELQSGGWKGGFGLGSIQWSFGRTLNLVKTYISFAGGNDTITYDQCVQAEMQMIINELNGDYQRVINNWRSANSNTGTTSAAYDAGWRICMYYEKPSNASTKAVERGDLARQLYIDMGIDTQAPVIKNGHLGYVSASGFNVYCTATDNMELKDIQLGIWHSAMSVDNAKWYTLSARNGAETVFNIPFSDFNDPKNVTYYVNAYAHDQFGNVSNVLRAGELFRESEPPVITGAQITNVTPLGYDVVCTARDNSKVKLIRIGTWHDRMNIDDAIWQEAASDGGRTVIHVNLADFSYAQGTTYHTNVYAFDANYNTSTGVRAGDCYIEKDLSSIVSVSNVSSTGYKLVCSAVGYSNAARLRIGTWHDKMNIDNAVWKEISGAYGTFSINTSEFNNVTNTTYHTNLYIIDSSGKSSEAIRAADIMLENVPPTVTSISVENVDRDGYDIVCSASDNAQVSRVQIGTWHDKMHVDNAVWQETRYTGDGVRIHVSVHDFSDVRDTMYHTNIYVFDQCNNVSQALRAGDVYITDMPVLENYDVLRLPEGLVRIEREAFAGIASQIVVIPESCKAIGDYAFAGADALEYVLIPEKANIEISSTAFAGLDVKIIRTK